MKLLDLTLAPAENLALDEALLDQAEATDSHAEVLRLWEPANPMVVLGRSSPLVQEVNVPFCETNQIEVFRRVSGGQAIVTGPGCLMYAVLLDYRKRPELRQLDKAHNFVMKKTLSAVQSLGVEATMEGTSDLTFQGRKFSGNSLRCKRSWMIYHGTLLCDFDIELIATCLGKPKREPEYRQSRTHAEFLIQLPVSVSAMKSALIATWNPNTDFAQTSSLLEKTKKLAADRYLSREWLEKVN